MPLDFDDPDAKVRCSRNVLMLCDVWSGWTTGLAATNNLLALELAQHIGVNVYSTVLIHPSAGHHEDAWDKSPNNPVKLIRFGILEDDCEGAEELIVRDLYKRFNTYPATLLKSSTDKIPQNVSYIIGHAPISAMAAIKLRESMYPDSKVILFYHVIPDELTWTAGHLLHTVPHTEELIRLAEAADVVYSVYPKVHSFFQAKFRTAARVAIDHRLLIPMTSVETFETDMQPIRMTHKTGVPCHRLLALCHGAGVEDWMGLDVAITAAGKVAAAYNARVSGESGDNSEFSDNSNNNNSRTAAPSVTLTIINVDSSHVITTRESLRREILSAERAGARIIVRETAGAERGTDKQLLELEQRCFDLCLLTTRCEPAGCVGLKTLSGGLPALVAEDSAVSNIIRRLTCNPDYYLVKTTRDVKAVKKDAAVWTQRIIHALDNPQVAKSQAELLKTALMKDELTRDTIDNFVSYCLDGIHVRFELTQMTFATAPDPDTVLDGPRELETRRQFNRFLLGAIRQAWRVKHNRLQSPDKLPVLLERLKRIPVEELVRCVIDVIEDKDRSIVGVDCKDGVGTLVVNCPDLDSLRDLWAMCDSINVAMRSVLLPVGQEWPENPILAEFDLRKALTRVVIAGPEYLQYKQHLMELREWALYYP